MPLAPTGPGPQLDSAATFRTGPRRGALVQAFVPRDEFDPETFNRRYFPDRVAADDAQRQAAAREPFPGLDPGSNADALGPTPARDPSSTAAQRPALPPPTAPNTAAPPPRLRNLAPPTAPRP
jgi:hypothetical protein